MTTIYLIRHAEAEGNVFRIAHGWYNSRITVFGQKQIDALERRFAGQHFDAIYASDLFRTRTTATAITRSRGMEAIPYPGLREGYLGAWENVSWGDIEKDEPEMLDYFNNDPGRWYAEGAEMLPQLQKRMVDSIRDIAAHHDGQTIAAVSHGAAIRALLSAVLQIRSEEIRTLGFCDNTAVTKLLVQDGEITVEYRYDNSHLKGGLTNFERRPWWKERSKKKDSNMRFAPVADAAARDFYRACRTDVGYPADEAGPDDERKVILCAYAGEDPAGIVALDTVRGAADKAGYIDFYYLAKQYRGNANSVQLLGQAVIRFREMGRDKVCAEIPAGSPLEGYFAHYGFESAGGTERLRLLEKDITVC